MKHKPMMRIADDGAMESDLDPDQHYARAETQRIGREVDPPKRLPPIQVRIGLDLGQINDPAAISVTEQEWRGGKIHHSVRRLERVALGTPYPAICDRVLELWQNLETMGRKREQASKAGFDPLLIIDGGGVGRPVFDLLEDRNLEPIPVVTVGGDSMRRREDGSWTVAKSLLVGSLLILIQSHRISLPAGPESDALVRELGDFKVDVSKAGNERYNAKHGSHDDLISALSLAVLPGLEPADDQSWIAVGKAKRKIG